MSSSSHRYAVYAAPPLAHPLHDFAARWLGWDPQSGQDYPPPSVPGLSAERVAALTAEPRRYGFHATLKPPFRLADGKDETALQQALADFAAHRSAPPHLALQLASLGNFLALRPAHEAGGGDGELHALADACVIAFDEFRAQASDAEIAKRRAAGLSARQDDYLLRWGYPYVLEEFRPHFTLTGRITDEAERAAVLAYLTNRLLPLLAQPMPLTELCLYRQSGNAQFRILARYPLTL
ncbi:DUF1045 domain-containing protein [Ferrovibrio sp.]|uniref:DUF1045 domain-containing protein n=1 Tax=Ferrovibrio sp. TaxID=1917215 RepID=UPI0025BE7134|nr:DUF1045 domain-containing protein [Ferrovibrio sp.]MBX3453261.1 DUF1045 domain-containing protein [Ferrovibrio sp.]